MYTPYNCIGEDFLSNSMQQMLYLIEIEQEERFWNEGINKEKKEYMTLEKMVAIAKVGEGKAKDDILVNESCFVQNFNMRKIMVFFEKFII